MSLKRIRMSQKRRSILKRIDWANHFMSFVGTCLGVLLAFYLANYHENKRNQERLELAMTNIKKEIERNRDNARQHADTLLWGVNAMNALKPFLSETYEIIGTSEQMTAFQKAHPGFYKLEKEEPVNDSLMNFHGSLELNFNIIPVSEIAWNNANSMDVLHLTDYQTSFQLHSLYSFQSSVKNDSQKLFENLKELLKNAGDDDLAAMIFEEYLPQMILTQRMEQSLAESYDKALEIIE